MVKEVSDPSEFASEIRGPGLVVVDFFATWCGPCQQIGPFVEQLSKRYPNVKFIKVDVDKSQIGSERGVRAMPTFHFYVKGSLVDEMKGANPKGLEDKIIQHQVDVNPFQGSGFSLGGGEPVAAPQSEASLREARLRALQGRGMTVAAPSPAPAPAPAAVPARAAAEEDEDIAMAIALSMQDGAAGDSSTVPPTNSSTTATAAAAAAAAAQDARDNEEAEAEQRKEDQIWDDEMVPVPVDATLFQELLEMGFPDTRARKGLVHGKTLEGAISWISENENDPNIDQPYMVKRSETVPKRVLTEEEKRQKLVDMKEKLRVRKEQQAREEKEAERKRELDRRKGGQELGEIQEERDRMQRRREAELAKREKQDAAREKQRILAEIARDKEMRKKNKGVLPSVLGVDGYNPSAVQYEMDVDPPVPPAVPASASAPASASSASSGSSGGVAERSASAAPARTTGASAAPAVENPEQKIDSAIETLMKYRANGAGGNALKLLFTFVNNVADSPDEPKFRAINTESAAYKSKLAPLVGPLVLLKSLGFQKVEEEGKLKLDGSINRALFISTRDKLSRAEITYRQLNG